VTPSSTFELAIVGAGIAGLTASAALRRIGIKTAIYEQAAQFGRVGAGIQMTPNAMKLLRGFGLEERLRKIGFAPDVGYNREWDTGNITYLHPMGAKIEQRFGAPDLMMHRAELHEALASLIPPGTIRYGKKLIGLSRLSNRLELAFADGSRTQADAVIGADGIHSVVRELLFGAEKLRFTGQVAYRAVFPTKLLRGASVDDRVKWWGPDRHIVSYMVDPRREEIYFIASTPEPDFAVESWSAPGDLKMLRDAYAGFHPNALAILEACPDVRKWALIERDPMPNWTTDSVLLIGDASHPMLPYMAQGAGSSMEDAVVLARCFQESGSDDINAIFRRCEANRKERTSQFQLGARRNTWMRTATATNVDWVYDYDAWTVPLA
jgi:salicylate hydroxylase/6-hydroxynicotinate 3-monooxygenase